jgi:hypothetical protein
MVYYVILIVLVVFIVVISFLEGNRIRKYDPILPFPILTPALVIAGYACSKLVFKRSLDKLNYKNDLITKMQGYRRALITKYIFLTLSSLLSTATSLVTGGMTFLALSLLMILLLFREKPSPIKAARDLQLHSENAQIISNRDKIIA